MQQKPFNKYFDHTLLKPEARLCDVKKLCREAVQYNFCAVCLNSCYVNAAAGFLKISNHGKAADAESSAEADISCDVKIAAVVGFPLGAAASSVKAFEASTSCENGASEIDMVINIGALKDGRDNFVADDIRSVVNEAHARCSIVKVIIETCLLTEDEIIKACLLSRDSGADFVKTSTGFSKYGAKETDIKLMRDVIGSSMRIKASGGIRDLSSTKKMIEAGADRIGASASVEIYKEYLKNQSSSLL